MKQSTRSPLPSSRFSCLPMADRLSGGIQDFWHAPVQFLLFPDYWKKVRRLPTASRSIYAQSLATSWKRPCTILWRIVAHAGRARGSMYVFRCVVLATIGAAWSCGSSGSLGTSQRLGSARHQPNPLVELDRLRLVLGHCVVLHVHVRVVNEPHLSLSLSLSLSQWH